MKVQDFVEILEADFFTGVPDSQLKALCDYLTDTYGISKKHIIAANEGNAVGLAAGYHMATGKVPVVYMQNSGLGNVVNPVTSLLNDKVYGIPCIFVIGWRGEPGIHDEPQHIYQGEITLDLLKLLDIDYSIIDKNTTIKEIEESMGSFKTKLNSGKSIAFVVRKGGLVNEVKIKYQNDYPMTREKIIEDIVSVTKEDPIICTTGKASRELFEIRERKNQGHGYDFLTVGSMGHAGSIAQAIALFKPDKKIWCIDGDGAALMHMGAMAVGGSNNLDNMIHIVINNEAHETVGGMPTVAGKVDWTKLAISCGYKMAYMADDQDTLLYALGEARKNNQSAFIEVKAGLGAREDLGRPTTTPKENRAMFEKTLRE